MYPVHEYVQHLAMPPFFVALLSTLVVICTGLGSFKIDFSDMALVKVNIYYKHTLANALSHSKG